MEIEPSRVEGDYEDFAKNHVSGDAPIGDDEDSYFGDFIPDETQLSPYDATSI